MTDDMPDTLVPDPAVCKEFSITPMTLWRWDRDARVNFPKPIRIRNRKFRSRREIEQFKQRVIRDARSGRGTLAPTENRGQFKKGYQRKKREVDATSTSKA